MLAQCLDLIAPERAGLAARQLTEAQWAEANALELHHGMSQRSEGAANLSLAAFGQREVEVAAIWLVLVSEISDDEELTQEWD